MSGVSKHQMRDKWEAHLPGKPNFVQGEYHSSLESERFHLSYGWKQEHGKRGSRFGVQRKMGYVSGCGIMVDGHYIGKSED